MDEIEDIFSNEVMKGEKPCKLMDVFDQLDLMFIKSVLQSGQIPYKIENENSSRIYSGSPAIETSVYVLEKDYKDAIAVLEEYNKAKKNNDNI
jgi:hypothetical protein